MINQKLMMTILAVVVIGWLAISAIDAVSPWNSPVPTVGDVGKTITCGSTQYATLNFDVTYGKFLGAPASIEFIGSEWTNIRTSTVQPFWLTTADYKVEVEVEYADHTKTYYSDAYTIDTGLGGDQQTQKFACGTDINHYIDECADDWSYVEGLEIRYTARLIENGQTVDTATGIISSV